MPTTPVLPPRSSHSSWCPSLEIHLLCLCTRWPLPLSCSPLHSTESHHMEHLSETVLGVHTRSTNRSQKSTVYFLWRRCCWLCAPVPSGRGDAATAPLHFSISENDALSEGKREKKRISVSVSNKDFEKRVSFPSVLQGWALWRTGPGATTTTSASTAPTASMADVSSCVSSSWLLLRMTPPSTTSRCSAGKSANSPLSFFVFF